MGYLAKKDKKDTKAEQMLLSFDSDGPFPALCQIISFVSLLAVIVQFFVGILKTLSGGPDFLAIGATMAVAVSSWFLAKELAVKRITMNKKHLLFSLGFAIDLQFKLLRKWTDIGAIALQSDEEEVPFDEEERRNLVFHFSSGGSCKVPLKALSVQDLDTLFRASKRWGSTAVMAPELIELRRKLVAGPNPSMNLSLTTLWERDLQSHFTTSTFVPLSTGSTLGHNRFRVISQIGAGGLSAIYLARANDGRKVILKELVLHKTSQETMNKAKELFQRESGILLKLNHPQIARVYDHFIENGRDYLVLAYIPGQTLRQLVETEGPRVEDKVLEWAYAIAGILHYLHSHNPAIIHRDISPENIVLGEDNLIHLIDFGAANEFAATATGTLIGKQAYIAPEQFRGKPLPSSDIYALGATMHFLLTGEDPEALSSSNPAAINSSVSLETSKLVVKLTDTDAGNRPSNCQEVMQLIADLRATDRGAVISIGKK